MSVKPPALTRLPLALGTNDPARVKYVVPEASFTTKKPLPLIARSVGEVVLCTTPCCATLYRVMVLTASDGALDAPASAITVSNWAEASLYPVVSEFEMLSPIKVEPVCLGSHARSA